MNHELRAPLGTSHTALPAARRIAVNRRAFLRDGAVAVGLPFLEGLPERSAWASSPAATDSTSCSLPAPTASTTILPICCCTSMKSAFAERIERTDTAAVFSR